MDELEFLDIIESPLIDGGDFFQLLLRFGFNFLVTGIIIHLFYYPKSKRRDYHFTFTLISISIFLMIFLLGSVKLKVGFALGLFAIFGIIRYRTESMPVREMTYLFVIIAISVINALGVEVNYGGLIGANLLFVLCIWLCESNRWLKHVSCKLILYDRIELIKSSCEQELIADIKARTGLKIIRVEVGYIDFLRDAAMLKIYYEPMTNEINTIDTLTKIPREMNKKLFLAGLFCLVSFALQAQKDDLGLWTSVGMEKRLFRDFDLSLEGEFRSRDKLSEVGRWSGSAGMAYKITNWLKAATAYTYIYYNHPLEITNKGNVISEYWQPKHRFYFQLTGKISLNRFTFSLRERWQYTYRPSQSVSKFDGDDGSPKDDEYVKGKGKNVLRSRLQATYNIPKCSLTPYASCELTHLLNDKGAIDKTRWTLGIEWKLSKHHGLDFYYLYQNHADDDEANGHVIGAGYTFKF